ncbi:integrase core domain-containing protein [Mycolicibacterium sp.]
MPTTDQISIAVDISDWKYDYNHHRRHSSLGYQPPARYAASCTHQ